MENGTYFYDFRINEKNLGFFEIKFEKDQIYQNVKFQDGNDVYENPFYLKLDSGKLVAFKKAAGDWVLIQRYGENHFPSSAYPILLGQIVDRLQYYQINEGNEEVEGITILEKSGSIINEYRQKKLMRSFKMENGLPVEINWGEAISRIKKTFAEAIEGSPLKV
jgi:hypothetical protein